MDKLKVEVGEKHEPSGDALVQMRFGIHVMDGVCVGDDESLVIQKVVSEFGSHE